MSQQFAELDNEFGILDQTAADAEIFYGPVPAVRRSRVNVAAGGHVSAVVWGKGPADVVFLHEAGRSARAWDEIALALGRPAAAIDLPGHGGSSWRSDRRYEPRKIAAAVAETILSSAPRARLVVGSGLGGLAALALTTAPRPPLLPQLVLVDTVPGTGISAPREPRTGPERFGSREEAVTFLSSVYPKWRAPSLRREVIYELEQAPDGSWAWRHHPGNMADPSGSQFDDLTLWDELAALAIPVWVIRGDRSARITADVLAELARRAPNVNVITVPAAEDVAADQPVKLAARLNRLLAA
jgi:pimeloyl-ACP methyl ester carboxylesterase